MAIYDGLSFGNKEYDRAIKVGTLGTMTFYLPNRQLLESFRARILGYSRTKKRQHILETTLIDDNHVKISYRGSLI